MYFTEINLTDYAYELALECSREGIVVQMYPTDNRMTWCIGG
jgi:hypothetical protein